MGNKPRAGASTHGRANRSRRITLGLFSLPGIFLYSLFFIYPVLMGIYYSFTNWNGIARSMNYVGWQNYAKILTNKRFLNALLFNLRYTVLLTVCIVVLGILLALLLNSRVRGLTFFRAAYFMPAVLSGITIGLIFSQIYARALPLLGQALGIDWLSKSVISSDKTAIYAVLFVNVWQGVAMPTVLFLAGLQTIPQDLYEAAAIDGANPGKRFHYITLPFLIPVLTVVMVLTIKSGISVFDYVKAITSGGPGRSTESVALLIYNHAFEDNKFSYAIAESVIVGLLVAAISAVQISFSNRKRV